MIAITCGCSPFSIVKFWLSPSGKAARRGKERKSTQEYLPGDDDLVTVRRQWNDWRHAQFRFSDLDNVHWDTVSGGVQAPCPQPFIHAYVWCDEKIAGELAHGCMHGGGPHSIKVCIVMKDNDRHVFERLRDLAGPKPPRHKLREVGHHP